MRRFPNLILHIMKKNFLWSMAMCVASAAAAQTDVQVDNVSGKAIVAIPIAKLTSGNLSANIAVGYSGGGLKVYEGEGSAGMSWSLSAGGAITRELNHLPDDYQITN